MAKLKRLHPDSDVYVLEHPCCVDGCKREGIVGIGVSISKRRGGTWYCMRDGHVPPAAEVVEREAAPIVRQGQAQLN